MTASGTLATDCSKGVKQSVATIVMMVNDFIKHTDSPYIVETFHDSTTNSYAGGSPATKVRASSVCSWSSGWCYLQFMATLDFQGRRCLHRVP